MTYEGWKNYETWNVALWINNEESFYNLALGFMSTYKGFKPYMAFTTRNRMRLGITTTDRVNWHNRTLDYEALDEMMWELAPNGARQVQ
jgi:hypothetical protein